MTPPRFQFTIRNLLWATFWVAMGMAGWFVPQHSIHLWHDQGRNEYSLSPAFVSVLVVNMAVISLFGLTMGRYGQAMRIAIISIAAAVVLTLLLVAVLDPLWGQSCSI